MAKKATAKTTAKSAAAKKTTAKTTTKRTTAKKPAAKKAAPASRTAAKKPAATKKAAAAKKSAAAKKPAAKKAPAKKKPAAAKKPAASKKAAAAPATDAKADAIKAAAAKVAAKRPQNEAPQKVVPKPPAHIKAKITAKARAKDKAAAPANGEALVFEVDQSIVYPAHGVGKITAIEKQQVAGMDLEFYVVSFDQDKMVLRVPTNRAEASGMRALAGSQLVENALKTLTGKARIKRTMWSRRAQEYEAKINSGSLISIAEVVRDLHRGEDQPEQSYSERQLYESALDRMARELSAVENIDHAAAMERLAASLAKKKPVAA